MADDDDDADAQKAQAYSTFIRLVLPPYTIHFKSPTYMREATLDMLDKKVCKETLKSTAQRAAVREAIGLDPKYWIELGVLLKAAIPSLERRSFTIWDPSSVDYESTSGALIASHYPSLWKDLERLNDLISISRNTLTLGTRVQDLAAWYNADVEVFRLINCCVRVTARGYDGDATTGDEEKWQWIVNAYKKLLITSLQFLNNMVAQNERRKLVLWVSLFDHAMDPGFPQEDNPPLDKPESPTVRFMEAACHTPPRPMPPVTPYDILVAFGTNDRESLELTGAQPLWDDMPHSDWPLPPEALGGQRTLQGNGYALYTKCAIEWAIHDWRIERKRDPTAAEIHLDVPRRWAELYADDRVGWQRMYTEQLTEYNEELRVYEEKMRVAIEQQEALRAGVQAAQQIPEVERKIAMLEEQLAKKFKLETVDVAPLEPPIYDKDGLPTFLNQSLQGHEVMAEDTRMLFTANAGTKILESGKMELLKRLEGYEPPDPNLPPSRHADGVTTRPVRTDQAGNPVERTRSMSANPPILDRSDPRLIRAEREAFENGNDTEVDSAEDEEVEEESGEEDDGEAEDDDEEEEEEEEEDEGEEDEEDYPGSTEDGRGLLTDVPLILGPSEIEVLPMLIMSGIVPPVDQYPDISEDKRNALLNFHTIRTHLLLSQSNGRNLLRELLIFVAAWDLREEELYFKFMVKIMEAILKNGLMPYAYHAFRDRSRSKDIISPAQAVIMKLLTCIFRARGEAAKLVPPPPPFEKHDILSWNARGVKYRHPPAILPTRVDLHILNFIFTEFRQHIIPQTCALIFLQGQIHAGHASPEEFPLNLWDMERMYEGVYQYLEFFAVLTEEGVWKGILGEWEMASELVTLLRELEAGIPKVAPVAAYAPTTAQQQLQKRAINQRTQQDGRSIDQVPGMPMPSHIAIERPFDVVEGAAQSQLLEQDPEMKLPPIAQQQIQTGVDSDQQPIFEPETPLAYPEDPTPLLHPHGLGSSAHDLGREHDQDEPSDFEWRNLKKLTVLVLSSLIWKNSVVQAQVRGYGGLEALVRCCQVDEHNPYIREHAIMCLRFAVENNAPNVEVVRKMGEVSGLEVPREVLDTKGYETFMDSKGQVGLRPKEPVTASAAFSAVTATLNSQLNAGGGIAKPPPRFAVPKVSPEKAAELMQTALRELPARNLAGSTQQRNEAQLALAKLDQAFESTEKVLRVGLGNAKKG